jgi:hypothetical protein
VTSVGEAAIAGGGNMEQLESTACSSKVTAVMSENYRGGVLWVFLWDPFELILIHWLDLL